MGENVEFNGKTHPNVPESKKKIDDEAKISNGKLLFGEGSSSIIFKKIGIDPAVASGPLITTVNDLVAVLVYYGTSLLLLVSVLGLS